MSSFVRRLGEERALRLYAAILGGLHALTALAWVHFKHVTRLVTGEDCVCWPLLPDCAGVRSLLSPTTVGAWLTAYGLLGLVASGLFLAKRPREGLGAFATACVLGVGLYTLDYRLRLNQTYMFGWVILAVAVGRTRALQVAQLLVALFYFWAGTLKLNAEWVSGAALYARPLLVPRALVPASCVYVLVLELVLVWGLFARSQAVRWAVYGQLLLFHVTSWSVVGYFYPLLMAGLTAVYPLIWCLAPSEALTFPRLLEVGPVRRACAVTAASFSSLQLIPYLFPGDTAITGEGRLFALHMFDARVVCEGGAHLHTLSGRQGEATILNPAADTRTRCDPLVILATAQRLCRSVAQRERATTERDRVHIDVAIDARRSSDVTLSPLVHVDDLCIRDLHYAVWHHNPWIGSGAAAPR